jgi:hypothetical protein
LYFLFKDVPEEKQVSEIAGGLQDGRVQMWYRLGRAKIDKAGFTKFMKDVREEWLTKG